MSIHRRDHGPDDRTVEQLLTGRPVGESGDLQALASFIAELRSTSATAVPVARPDLEAIFATGVVPGGGDTSAVADHLPPRTRRQRMLTALSAFVATVTGKVVVGTAVAAASVGSAHAAGMVDVPGLPERAATVVEDGPVTPDTPAVDNAGGKSADDRPDIDTAKPDSPGVDGDEVADRATSGEPQEDGKAFGTSIADEATEGTPAEDRPAGGEEAAQDKRPDVPAGGADNADESKPDSTPGDGADTADQAKPEDPAPGRP